MFRRWSWYVPGIRRGSTRSAIRPATPPASQSQRRRPTLAGGRAAAGGGGGGSRPTVAKALHLLGDLLAEQAARRDEQHQQEDQEGEGILVGRRDIGCDESLHDADEERADDRAGDAAKAADDTRHERLEHYHAAH